MKVALVYDRVNKWGGAERVLLVLHEMFPQAPLYTSVYDPARAPWARVFPKICTSFLQNFPLARGSHELFALLMPLAFESFSSRGGPAFGGNFDEYDLVISVTSEAAKGIITKPKTRHVCYCLTPTRYLWSGYGDYFRDDFLRFVSKPVVSYLKAWDRIAAQRPDFYIAISKEVQSRIKNYYGRESVVVYPPVKLARGPVAGFPPASARGLRAVGSPSTRTTPRSGYFLIVSRLVPYKRIDIAIEAFNKLGWPLKIVGSGVEEGRLKRMVGKNIEFLGNLTDYELFRYYEDCTALVVPGIEDFGLSIVEAQAAGKPVIAFKAGGALESIIEGRTGAFFDRQTAEALIKVLKDFDAGKYRKEDCVRNAKRFSVDKFKIDLIKLIDLISNQAPMTKF